MPFKRTKQKEGIEEEEEDIYFDDGKKEIGEESYNYYSRCLPAGGVLCSPAIGGVPNSATLFQTTIKTSLPPPH